MDRRNESLKFFTENNDFTEERIKSGIEQNRKGYMNISVVNKDGSPVSGAVVKVKLKNHEFKYGANIFMLDEMESEEKNQKYRKCFKDAFNLATVPFYWKDLEPVKGKPRYNKNSPKVYRRPAPDLCLEFCEKYGIEPKAHCLNYIYWNPDWLPTELNAARKELIRHFSELADRYADKIPKWEVVNETILGGGWLDKNPLDISPNLIEWSFNQAEKYFPSNELIINESTVNVWKDFLYNRSSYYMLCERALRNGAEIDTIGMQYHMFDKEEEIKNYNRYYYNPRMIYAIMDQYAKLGCKLQLTEVTIPAFGGSEEDEQLQAEIIKKLYSIWFSHEAVNGIVYWNLIDGYCYTGESNPGDMTSGENAHWGGLIRFDLTPKPSYYVIKDMFTKEWITDETKVTDDSGKLQCKGFYGDYDIEICVGNEKVNKKINFLKTGTTKFELKLN